MVRQAHHERRNSIAISAASLFLLFCIAGPALADTTPPTDTSASATPTAPAVPAAPLTPKQMRERQVERVRQLYAAMRYYEAGKFAKAEEIALKVLADFPADTMAMTITGAARIRQGNHGGAMEIFSNYTAQYPFDARAQYYLGVAWHLLGDRDKAVDAYWTALLIDPTLEAARVNMRQLDDR